MRFLLLLSFAVACPDIYYKAKDVIFNSPQLISSNVKITAACHQCISKMANSKFDIVPNCKRIGMDGFNERIKIQEDCHCLAIGLMEECAMECLPNPLCEQESRKVECSNCVREQQAFCGLHWNSTCREECFSESCSEECAVDSMCHSKDSICANCVRKMDGCVENGIVSYNRRWSGECTRACYSKECFKECHRRCGDAHRTEDEDCDDGNALDLDGCDSNCKVEHGYVCQDDANLRSSCFVNESAIVNSHDNKTECGNGKVEVDEECDDGNLNAADGCDARCRVENCVGLNCEQANCDNVRKAWMNLDQDEKDTFQQCLNIAFQREGYQKLVGIHVYHQNDQYSHNSNGFLPWHRKFLLVVQSLLRSYGGDCTCVTIPYWNWDKEAALMTTNNCETKLACSPTMQEWGGGGNINDTYKAIPIWNDPVTTKTTDTASGYCVLNNITQHWRANYKLGPKYSKHFDASCPIIRRGWADWGDEENGIYYAAPSLSQNMLSVVASIGYSATFEWFAVEMNGDMHILPHDNAGGLLATFASPADPLFLLHHSNLDRLWTLWENCHRCSDSIENYRTGNSKCYRSTFMKDQITKTMPFWYFERLENGTYDKVQADDAADFTTWWPQGFITAGDMLGTTTLGKSFSYTYEHDDLDVLFLSSGHCQSESSSLLQSQHRPNDALVAYIDWYHDITRKLEELVKLLRSYHILNTSLEDIPSIAATCECMHIYANANQYVHDISPATKRKWPIKENKSSCFFRITHNSQHIERKYCTAALAPDFDASKSALIANFGPFSV